MHAENYISNWHECAQHLISKWPEEAGGIIVRPDNIFIPIDNVAEDKLTGFHFDSALLDDYDVRCILHSHPIDPNKQLQKDPREPSKEDLIGQRDTAVEWAIVVTDGENCDKPVFWGDFDHRPPLMEREFIYNIQDCFDFWRDWMYQNKDVKMPAFIRDAEWYNEGFNYFEENYHKYNMMDVTDSSVQIGDMVLYKIRAHSAGPTHCGIVVGPNEFVHHDYNKMPTIQRLSRWQEHLVRRLRYANT